MALAIMTIWIGVVATSWPMGTRVMESLFQRFKGCTVPDTSPGRLTRVRSPKPNRRM